LNPVHRAQMTAILTTSRPAYNVKNQPAKCPAEKSDGLGRIFGGIWGNPPRARSNIY
jgi:hypothetical protein